MFEERITMNKKELLRLEVMEAIKLGKLTQALAGKRLGISVRQIRRLFGSYKLKGAFGLVSQRRGKPSNNRLDEELKERAVSLIRVHYNDFGPKFAGEKLEECHGIKISRETLRQMMIKEGIWQFRKRKKARIHQTPTTQLKHPRKPLPETKNHASQHVCRQLVFQDPPPLAPKKSVKQRVSCQFNPNTGCVGLHTHDRPRTLIGPQGSHVSPYALLKAIMKNAVARLDVIEAVSMLYMLTTELLDNGRAVPPALMAQPDHTTTRQKARDLGIEITVDPRIAELTEKIHRLHHTLITKDDFAPLADIMEQKDQILHARIENLLAWGNAHILEQLIDYIANLYLIELNRLPHLAFPHAGNLKISSFLEEGRRIKSALEYLRLQNKTILYYQPDENLPDDMKLFIAQAMLDLFWYPKIRHPLSDKSKKWQQARKKYNLCARPRTNDLETFALVTARHIELILDTYPYFFHFRCQLIESFVWLVAFRGKIDGVTVGWGMYKKEREFFLRRVKTELPAYYFESVTVANTAATDTTDEDDTSRGSSSKDKHTSDSKQQRCGRRRFAAFFVDTANRPQTHINASARPPTNLGRQGHHASAYALIKEMIFSAIAGCNQEEVVLKLYRLVSRLLPNGDTDPEIVAIRDRIHDLRNILMHPNDCKILAEHIASDSKDYTKLRVGLEYGHIKILEDLCQDIANLWLRKRNKFTHASFPCEGNLAPPKGENNRVRAALGSLRALHGLEPNFLHPTTGNIKRIAANMLQLIWYPKIPDEKLLTEESPAWQRVQHKYNSGICPRTNDPVVLSEVIANHLELFFACFPNFLLHKDKIIVSFMSTQSRNVPY